MYGRVFVCVFSRSVWCFIYFAPANAFYRPTLMDTISACSCGFSGTANCECMLLKRIVNFQFPFRCARAWILVFTSGVCITGMHEDLTDSIAVTRDIRTVESEWVVEVARLSCIYWKRIFYQCALCGRIFRIWERVCVCDLHTKMPLLSAAVFAFCILLPLWVVLIQVTSYKNDKYMRTECRINVQIVGGRWDTAVDYIFKWNKSHCRRPTCDYLADESNWSHLVWFRCGCVFFFFSPIFVVHFSFSLQTKTSCLLMPNRCETICWRYHFVWTLITNCHTVRQTITTATPTK